MVAKSAEDWGIESRTSLAQSVIRIPAFPRSPLRADGSFPVRYPEGARVERSSIFLVGSGLLFSGADK